MRYYKLVGWHHFMFKRFYVLVRRNVGWPLIRVIVGEVPE